MAQDATAPELTWSDDASTSLDSRTWTFAPKEDITVQELAKLLAHIKIGVFGKAAFDELPDELKRHFTEDEKLTDGEKE